MKIRIKGNSIRLRLTKTEVEKLPYTKIIEEHTTFTDSRFVYAIQSIKGINKLSSIFLDGKLTVFIPEEFVREWNGNDVVGIDARVRINDKEELYILVEKDFKCMEETTEDQSDNFENPNLACSND